MKNIKEKILFGILGLTILELLKFTILLVYIITDKNFYDGIYNNRAIEDIFYKMWYMNLIPLLVFTFITMFFLYRKFLGVLSTLLIYIITIFLYRIFDYRDLLFFITNHRAKLYIIIVLSILLILVVSVKLLKFKTKKTHLYTDQSDI